jgi:hypothetical protein
LQDAPGYGPAHFKFMKQDSAIVFADEFFFAPLGVLLGVILLLPALVIPFLEKNIPLGGYVVLSGFLLCAVVLIFTKEKVSYDREKRVVLKRKSLFGLGFTFCRGIDNYKSMGSGYLDGGQDFGSHDSMVTRFVHYEFILFGKKGRKNLVLYRASGARSGFFPAEKKFNRVAEKIMKHLPLKQERCGP